MAKTDIDSAIDTEINAALRESAANRKILAIRRSQLEEVITKAPPVSATVENLAAIETLRDAATAKIERLQDSANKSIATLANAKQKYRQPGGAAPEDNVSADDVMAELTKGKKK